MRLRALDLKELGELERLASRAADNDQLRLDPPVATIESVKWTDEDLISIKLRTIDES